MIEPWRGICDHIAAACIPSGLDLVQPFRVSWYNEAVDPAYRLPDLGNPNGFGILIGNSRALWPALRAAISADPSLATAPDPIDRYTEAHVLAALRPLSQRWEIRWVYE